MHYVLMDFCMCLVASPMYDGTTFAGWRWIWDCFSSVVGCNPALSRVTKDMITVMSLVASIFALLFVLFSLLG